MQFLTVIDPLHPLMIQSKIIHLRCRWPLMRIPSTTSVSHSVDHKSTPQLAEACPSCAFLVHFCFPWVDSEMPVLPHNYCPPIPEELPYIDEIALRIPNFTAWWTRFCVCLILSWLSLHVCPSVIHASLYWYLPSVLDPCRCSLNPLMTLIPKFNYFRRANQAIKRDSEAG